MIQFAHPWCFLFGLLPLVIRRLLPPFRQQQPSVQVPFFRSLAAFTGRTPAEGAVVYSKILIQKIALIVTWILLVTAMAGPQWLGDPIVHTKSARDIMIAADISGSMGTLDFTSDAGEFVSRLDGVKTVLREFVKKRRHDRMGLIVFGTSPYLQAPFTDDHPTWLALLNETRVGMAGQKTNFGDAMGLAIRLFEQSETRDRVLVVLTDGNDTGSRVPPVEAAKIAAAKKVKIYTIAVGDPASTGQEEIDTEVLERIARITGGGFFEAQNRRSLEAAHQDILSLEPETYETIVFSPKRPLHHFLLGAIVILYNLLFGMIFLKTALTGTGSAPHEP